MAKTFEVVLKKHSVRNEWCPFDETMVSRIVPTTVAVLTGKDKETLDAKIARLYPGIEVISVKQIRQG